MACWQQDASSRRRGHGDEVLINNLGKNTMATRVAGDGNRSLSAQLSTPLHKYGVAPRASMRRALLRRATETYSQQYGARSATKRERMQRRSNATVFVKTSS